MKSLRNPTKSELIVNMFPDVGDRFTVDDVCAITGIKNYNSLKAMLSYIRRAQSIPEESRVDIRIDGDYCMRVN